MKTLAIFAVSALAVGFASTATRADIAADAPLPPTYIVYKLTQDGIALRQLEAGHGVYEARVEATDGSIVKVGVDPLTAELTDAFSHARARAADGASPRINAAEAIQAVAATGYWDIGAIEYERGMWQVRARDDQGRSGRFAVDPTTGVVK
jgi:hypothetical protein